MAGAGVSAMAKRQGNQFLIFETGIALVDGRSKRSKTGSRLFDKPERVPSPFDQTFLQTVNRPASIDFIERRKKINNQLRHFY
jgi:hypothetical protein